MEKKKRKYSIDEKEKLAKLCAKYKDEYDNFEGTSNYNSRKRKHATSSLACGYLSKAVREMYPSMKDKSSEDPDFKKAVQLARRSYQAYQENSCDEPVNKKTKYRQAGGGRKSVAVEVRKKSCISFSLMFFYTYIKSITYTNLTSI